MVIGCRVPSNLRTQSGGVATTRCKLREQSPQRSQTGGPPDGAAGHFRTDDQPQDRQGAWIDDSADAARPCRRGDRIRKSAAMRMSPFGTKRTSDTIFYLSAFGAKRTFKADL